MSPNALQRIAAEHGFAARIDGDVVHVSIPWSRLLPDGTRERGIDVQTAHSISSLRRVLGY